MNMGHQARMLMMLQIFTMDCKGGSMRVIILTFCFMFLACIPEQYKQTADLVSKGANRIEKQTPADSPTKKDAVALKNLAEAHSKKELGEPEEPKVWSPETAEEQTETIDRNAEAGFFGLNWAELGLIALLLGRFLKSIGIYMPKGFLITLVKGVKNARS